MNSESKAALERLIGHAKRESSQSRRIAEFLLAWWNARICGGFDLIHLWAVDDKIREDMTTVFAFIGVANVYPGTLGYSADFEEIVRIWRPELLGTP